MVTRVIIFDLYLFCRKPCKFLSLFYSDMTSFVLWKQYGYSAIMWLYFLLGSIYLMELIYRDQMLEGTRFVSHNDIVLNGIFNENQSPLLTFSV